jgi:hypothetical protein
VQANQSPKSHVLQTTLLLPSTCVGKRFLVHIQAKALLEVPKYISVSVYVRGCKGFLRSTMNLYINKEEKTEEGRTLCYSSINTNILLCCLGNESYDNQKRRRKCRCPRHQDISRIQPVTVYPPLGASGSRSLHYHY